MQSTKILKTLNPEESVFTLDEMTIAVANKKKRRAVKKMDFNCFVLDRDEKNDELATFLTHLQSIKSDLVDGTRFQIVYRYLDHWSTMDVQIKSGKLSFYLFDAANDIPKLLSAMTIINNIFPDAILSFTAPSIQHDRQDCATFAFDAACRLAKISELHSKIGKIDANQPIGPFKNYNEYLKEMMQSEEGQGILDILADDKTLKSFRNSEGKFDLSLLLTVTNKLKYISSLAFPVEFAPLMRNAQSFQILGKIFNLPGYENAKGNDTQLLQDYVKARTTTIEVPVDPYADPAFMDDDEGSKNINSGIVSKRSHIKNKANLFLKDLDEKSYAEIIENRQGLKQLATFLQKKTTADISLSKAHSHLLYKQVDETKAQEKVAAKLDKKSMCVIC